ncbi:MAG: N-acetyl-gamma-glutamyl-phosphate reductase [Planctomycetota bacterium]
MPIDAAIVGPTGYTGFHLIDLLLRHPEARPTYLASRRAEPIDLRNEFPALGGRLSDAGALTRPIDAAAIADAADVAFLALPHTASMALAPALLDAGVRVIDLSADYRLQSAELFENVYATPHTDAGNLLSAVYGLPELFRDAPGAPLRGATLVANPGCYPTAAALAIAPLLSHSLTKSQSILINAASGVSGAGRSAKTHLLMSERFGGYGAYGKLGGHRHQPEIAQSLSRVAGHGVSPLFVPHLLPVDVGILETIYLDPVDGDVTEADLVEAYQDAYADEPFVRLVDHLPDIKHVRGTNFVDLHVGLARFGESTKVVAFAAMDNLIKGASGQAVQNMNAVFGLPETCGLI